MCCPHQAQDKTQCKGTGISVLLPWQKSLKWSRGHKGFVFCFFFNLYCSRIEEGGSNNYHRPLAFHHPLQFAYTGLVKEQRWQMLQVLRENQVVKRWRGTGKIAEKCTHTAFLCPKTLIAKIHTHTHTHSHINFLLVTSLLHIQLHHNATLENVVVCGAMKAKC